MVSSLRGNDFDELQMSGNEERNAQAFHSVACGNSGISYFALGNGTKSDCEVQKHLTDICELSAYKDQTFYGAISRDTKTF